MRQFLLVALMAVALIGWAGHCAQAAGDAPHTEASLLSLPVSGDTAGTREGSVEALRRDQSIDSSLEEAKSILAGTQTGDVAPDSIQTKLPSPDVLLEDLVKPENRAKTLDLEFDDTTLEGVLQTIGEAAGINIILDPVLKTSMVSLHLKKVIVIDALNILAASYNLGFKKVGGALFVTTKEKMHQEGLVSKVIKLRYIKAQALKDMAHNLLETVTADVETNSLVVSGMPEDITRVEALVAHVDVPQPQVVLEAKIIEINRDALRDLGIDWPDVINGSFQESGREPTVGENKMSSEGSPLKVFSFARSAIQFDTAIRMLENNNKAKVLSNPRIITLNNQQAEIFVGDRVPYTITSVTGGVATTEVRFVEPGIRLRITPAIIDKEFVQIKIEPEVSFIYAWRGPQDQYPWVKTRNATAFVRVQNNESFVLGGLLNQEDKKNFYKVPILGDVPLLGNLFSYQKHSVADSELIITVTPVITNNRK